VGAGPRAARLWLGGGRDGRIRVRRGINMSPQNVAVHSHYRDQFERLEPQLAGAKLPWLRNARRESFDRFAGLGFPTTRTEDCKYTNVASIEKRAFISPASSNGVARAQVNDLALPGAQWVGTMISPSHA